MRPYEVVVIFDSSTDPPAIQAVVDRALDTVRSTGGAPGQVDRWGKRQFAYEVNHKREGYYIILEMSGETETVRELDRLLTLADEVVRHKVIRLPDKQGQPGGAEATVETEPEQGTAPEQAAG
jgi:small subunit ribosomal protein S6